jgi:hypothetical protein
MEMLWVTPFILLFYRPGWTWSPLVVFALLCLGLLVWIMTLEWLNTFKLDSPVYELAVLGLMVITSLLLIIFWPYSLTGGAAGGVGHLLGALTDLRQGLPTEFYLILLNLFLWQRAASASSRELSFFSVGLSFRLGIIWLILGGGLFSYFSGQNIFPLLWLYFSLGLTAVALARIDDKAADARSTGKFLPRQRLVQLLLVIGATIGLTAILSGLYTPERLRAILLSLEPLWIVILIVLILLLQVIFWLLEPFFRWLEPTLVNLFAQLDLQLRQFTEGLTEESAGQSGHIIESLPPWVWVSLRCGAISVLILLVLGLILLFLGNFRLPRRRAQPETIDQEEITLGSGILNRGLDRLKSMARLVRRYGLSRQLLAAISIENIYANLCRLARQRGHPRHPAQPPDDYLPMLAQAFPGQEEALSRLTAAYMRVHYGDRVVGQKELAQLRADYERVRRVKVE